MNVSFDTIPISLFLLFSQSAHRCCFLSPIWLSFPLEATTPSSLCLCFTGLLWPPREVLPLMPCPICSCFFYWCPLTNFLLFVTFLLPRHYQQPSHSLYLPLYNWCGAGVVFSSHRFIFCLLFCCLVVEMARVQRVLSFGEGEWEMGEMPVKNAVQYANR